MTLTSDYTATPEVKCPCCRIQPLNVQFDWAKKLRITRGYMPCCNGYLSEGQVGMLLGRIERARKGNG